MNSAVTPTQNEINLAPLRIYDTYVAWGEEVAVSDQDRPNFQAGVIDKDNITEIVWFKQGTTLPLNGFFIGQVTLNKTNANGTWSFDLNPEGVADVLSGKIDGLVNNGVMTVTNITYSLNGSEVYSSL